MSNKVVSKYFSNAITTVMDDSLSDFQEKKTYNAAPKNVKKTRNIKKPKPTRGQKDIRTLIKKQENDVLTYSKDFDKVCKQAGVDVDSEELQLAIALSKSLQEEKKEVGSEAKNTEHLTSQQRSLKIKTTLQEYGFRVPKTKASTNRKKKCRKQCKLLLISETERQQIISDKYSEVLAGNIFKSPTKVLERDINDSTLYYKTTNISYECIKNDDIYYIRDLFDKPEHKTCLLRDWSEIPGRPLSPTLEVNNINFENVICNQHELDCILSGTVFTAQHIVTNKETDTRINIDKAIELRLDQPKPLENEDGCIDHEKSGKLLIKEIDCYTKSNTMSVSKVRCISPDIFDDEVSTVLDCTDTGELVSEHIVSMTDNINTYCMDLTECVNVDSYNIYSKPNQHTYNGINITNRKSNDFMEITKCVSITSKEANVKNIDLTQNPNYSKQQIDKVLSQTVEIMDLTQGYDTPAVKICYTKKDDDDTIILVDEQNFTLRDLPDTICIDDINCEHIYDKGDCKENTNYDKYIDSFEKKENEKNCFDSSCKNVDTVCLDDETNLEKYSDKTENMSIAEKDKDQNTNSVNNNSYKSNWEHERHSLSNIDEGSVKIKLVECQPDEIDLTQSSNTSNGETVTNQQMIKYSTSLGKRDNISIDYDEIYDNIVIANDSQTSLKFELHEMKQNVTENTANESKEIVSNPIKCFELSKFSDTQNIYLDQLKYDNSDIRDVTVIINDENNFRKKESYMLNNDIASNPSKSSLVFEISDKELNCSLHQSIHENFDFRDVSVINDCSNFDSNTISDSEGTNSGIKNRSLSQSNIIPKDSPFTVTSHDLNLISKTPKIKLPNENVKNVLQTPKMGEYIIKTNEVTPMLDYAAMSSPERHKELDKYGLKPFKRKRAIQLLTYLYNQTHPLVESHDDDCLSPSKKQKTDDGDKLSNLPKNLSKSALLATTTSKPIPKLINIPEMDIENDLHAVTNEQPDIRNIECNAEDWVFQKREKAKLHSCRVPLHIAFHNYVTCRRKLREAILRYEPVNIDVIHKELVATGYRYNPKDLLKFMDKKCITVRTADNNSRNRKS